MIDLWERREELRQQAWTAWLIGAPDAARRAELAVREFPSLYSNLRRVLGVRGLGDLGLGSRRWD